MRCGLEVEVYLVAPLCRDALRVYHTKPGVGGLMDHSSVMVDHPGSFLYGTRIVGGIT